MCLIVRISRVIYNLGISLELSNYRTEEIPNDDTQKDTINTYSTSLSNISTILIPKSNFC